MKKLSLMFAVTAALGGCVHPPPPTVLESSWNRYQLCVHQSKNSNVECARLKLAYEAQLNRVAR